MIKNRYNLPSHTLNFGLCLRQAGLTTIAQDAPSSVVYGMPKAARELGAAQSILPLGAIGQELMHALECPLIPH